MKTIARLIYLYFFGAAGLRWLSAGGSISIVACVFLWQWRPDGLPAILFGLIGFVALFVGTSLMPEMVARTAGGHWSATVPDLRIKLLVSALLTVVLVSLPVFVFVAAGVGQTAGAAGSHLAPRLIAAERAYHFELAWISWASTANLLTWLYVVAWLVTDRRTVWGLTRALLVLSLVLYTPVKAVATLNDSLWLRLEYLCATWTMFAVLFLGWPRWKTLGNRIRIRHIPARLPVPGWSARDRFDASSGHATDVLLGTAHPWLMAAALSLPTLFAVRISTFFPGAWLYCLALFSTSSAAIAGQASMRSRALWLRGGWSPGELFRAVERSFWQHNFVVLAVLLTVMFAVGTYVGLTPQLMALGMPLLLLGTALGTYLGLMVTRGMQWQETALGVAVMLSLMAGALMVARADLSSTADVMRLAVLAVALSGATLAFRVLSRRRWQVIDWTACRPERALRARVAA